jgi:hypothetical protein
MATLHAVYTAYSMAVVVTSREMVWQQAKQSGQLTAVLLLVGTVGTVIFSITDPLVRDAVGAVAVRCLHRQLQAAVEHVRRTLCTVHTHTRSSKQAARAQMQLPCLLVLGTSIQ